MQTVKSVMTTIVYSVTSESKLRDAIHLMLNHSISGLPVIDENEQIVGVITEYDLLGILYGAKLTEIEVSQYMSKDVVSVDENDELGQVVDLMVTEEIRRLPVTRNGRLAGIVSRRDLIRRILQTHDETFTSEEVATH